MMNGTTISAKDQRSKIAEMANTTEVMTNADRTPGSVPSLDKLAAVAMVEAEAMKTDAAGQDISAGAACLPSKAKMNELFVSNGFFGRAAEAAVAGALTDIIGTSSSASRVHDTEQTKTDFSQSNNRPQGALTDSFPLQEKSYHRVHISGHDTKGSDKIDIKRAAFSKSSLSVSEIKKTKFLQSQLTHQHKKGLRDIGREKCLRENKTKDTRQKQPQMKESKDGNQQSVAVSTEWIKNYIELQKHYQIHGDCHVSTKGLYKDKPLAKWVAKQKKEYKLWRTLKAQGHGHVDRRIDNGIDIDIECDMTKERILLLENIGMEWADSKWESRKKAHFSNPKHAKHGRDSCHHPIDHHDRRNGSHHDVSRSKEARADDAEQAIMNPKKGSGNGYSPVRNVIKSDKQNASNLLLDSMPDGEWKTRFHELVECEWLSLF